MKPRIASQWSMWKGIRWRRHAFALFLKRCFAHRLVTDAERWSEARTLRGDA